MPTASGTGKVSLATLLAMEHPMLMDAWARGEDPEYLFVHPTVYQAVAVAKHGQSEDYWSSPLQLMGLTLVASESTPPDYPRLG